VTRAELSRAKSQIEAEVALGLESTASRRESASRAWLYRGHPHEADEYLAEIRRATADDVAEAASLLFGSLGLAVTGPSLAGATVEDLAGELAA
jgi:predicted Zn-dependent peptidase